MGLDWEELRLNLYSKRPSATQPANSDQLCITDANDAALPGISCWSSAVRSGRFSGYLLRRRGRVREEFSGASKLCWRRKGRVDQRDFGDFG